MQGLVRTLTEGALLLLVTVPGWQPNPMNSHSPYKHNKNNHRDISEGKQHHGFKWRFWLVSHLVNMLEDLVTGVETSSLHKGTPICTPIYYNPYYGEPQKKTLIWGNSHYRLQACRRTLELNLHLLIRESNLAVAAGGAILAARSGTYALTFFLLGFPK